MRRLRRSSGMSLRQGIEGFTLLEVLVALTILGVATFILINMFLISVGFDKHSRMLKIASDEAESVLAKLTTTPEAYVWPSLDEMAQGEPVALELRDASLGPGHNILPPAALPTLEGEARKVTTEYAELRWDAYAGLPEDNGGGGTSPPYLEVVVVIRWHEGNVPRSFSISSTIPYAWVEGAA